MGMVYKRGSKVLFKSCQVTFKNNGQFQKYPPPQKKKKKQKKGPFGGVLLFGFFSLIFCSGVTKLFLVVIVGDWDIFVNFFDYLSVSHQNKGVKKKKQKMPNFRKKSALVASLL